MTIPRILHQTWRSATVPAEWQPLVARWRRLHPDWEYCLWTDEDNQRLVDEHYPGLVEQYASCPYGIQRADMARYLMLHRRGGVYVDLDVDCLRPLDALVDGQECVLTLEPDLHAAWTDRPRLVSNAFIASAPDHSFLNVVLEMLRTRELRISVHEEVLGATGPGLLADALERHGPTGILMLPADAFSPLTSDREELDLLRRGEDVDRICRQWADAGSWGIHYWANTWARTLAGDLIGGASPDIAGFVFHQGYDSPGLDMKNAGRDVARLAELCAAIPTAAGFNTDGFIKGLIRHRSEWARLPYAAANEGLYVRRAFHFGGRSRTDR